MSPTRSALARCGALILLALVAAGADAGPLRDLLQERRAQRQEQQSTPDRRGHRGADDDEEDGGRDRPAKIDAGIDVLRDIAYGSDPLQRYDVYRPQRALRDAPVIFMVHGGGWRRGDKRMANVIEGKVNHWVPMGFILVSVDYRMLPGTAPLEQARDVARALASAQQKAAGWGGDPSKFILMGHSAGAHLVSLVSSSPAMASAAGASRWLGTVPLDSAAYDVARIMESRHMRLYDEAFGKNPDDWRAASPYDQLAGAVPPFLSVCSSHRRVSCQQAEDFAEKAKTLGTRVTVQREDKSHMEINDQVGKDPAYTRRIEDFLRTLDPRVAALLGR